MKGDLRRPNLCEIYKNATRCFANRRLFCIFHPNSTLLDLSFTDGWIMGDGFSQQSEFSQNI